ncbi:caspase [Nonomuraea sp. WAC 01424]|uniref:caspase, EACC1-associated type n=1 Tax=Nonomuraea sp. WAC 01424 TaxID=2203200 RepID=UPI000F7ADC99|nr:caspase family protein [Nonomuraea sp. WAC 01424]RSM96241.1 caspase [Nonomuraea sp. WAC 01424]
MSGARRALIVANDEYSDPGLAALLAPNQDAIGLADVLGDENIGGFDVQVRRNANVQELRLSIEDFFVDAARDDLLLLHFSGHGLKSPSGELYLSASDTRPDRLASTGLSAEYVSRLMLETRAQRVVLFLDCCYGGAFPRGMVVRGTADAAVGEAFLRQERAGSDRGRVVVTASSAIEYAFEGRDMVPDTNLSPSVFTAAVINGLATGDADLDGDGWIGVRELFDYVADQVRKTTPHQTPHIWIFGAQGDVRMARVRASQVVATPVPAVLVEAMNSPLAGARFGVVHELRERLLGEDLGQALTACQMLHTLAEDDSRQVSRAAEALLAEARPHVTAPLVDFGSIDLSTWSEKVELALNGPPVACAVTAVPSVPWLRLEVRDRVLSAQVFGDAAGRLAGIGTLTAPAGETTIEVQVSVEVPDAVRATQPMPISSLRPSGALVWPPRVKDIEANAVAPRRASASPTAFPAFEILQRLAPWRRRLVARLIDAALNYVIAVTCGYLIYLILDPLLADGTALMPVVIFGLCFVCEFMLLKVRGQSTGKMLTRIKVVEIGAPPASGLSNLAAFQRTLPLVAPVLLMDAFGSAFSYVLMWLYWIAVLLWARWDKPLGRSLLDKAAGTIVVTIPAARKPRADHA